MSGSGKIKHIGQLKQDQRNPRRHNPRNLKVITDSLQKVGFARSIVIDEDDNILAGNGVTEAAAIAGIERVVEIEADGNTIVAVRRRGLTEEQKQALKYYDNRAGDLAEWNPLQFVTDIEAGLDLSGLFDGAELAAILEAAGTELLGKEKPNPEPQVDKAAELAKKWGTATGQLWQLGRHRVYCADSTDNVLLEKIAGNKIDTVFTDIPYGIDYSGGRTQVVRHKPYGRIQGDKDSDVSKFVTPLFALGARDIWVCASPVNLGPALAPFDEKGGVNAIVVWDKKRPGLGYQWIRRQCEFVLFYTIRQKARDDDSEFDLWSISTDSTQEYMHGTQKPVDLPERALLFSGSRIVADLYLGSGSTLMACEKTGARLIGVDIDPMFVAVTIQRWVDLTDDTPVLLETV